MASSHYVITRQARSAAVAGRLDELEEALVVLDGDLQRIDQVEDDVARLDLLTDRVERLDQAVSEYGGGVPATGASAPVVEHLRKTWSSCAAASMCCARISPRKRGRSATRSAPSSDRWKA